MKLTRIFSLTLGLLLLGRPARAEEHRATRLGNPATRFAPTLHTPEDLRSRFHDEKLRPDVAEVLRQWGWHGNVGDLHHAALTNEISDIKIPVGTTMPFMSSREGGKAICLRNVLWAGKEPISAYAFNFSSNGRRYRCVTPKPCSNFFVEDLGTISEPELALECSAPEQVVLGRQAQVCLTVRNTGNVAESKLFLTLPLAPGSTLGGATEGGVLTNGLVRWELDALAPGSSRRVCASFNARQLGAMPFNSTVTSANAKPVPSSCSTRVVGIPAILLETADLQDPIAVGNEVTYIIKVTNQGTSAGTLVRVVCTLPASEEFVSGTGSTQVQSRERTLTMDALPALEPKAVASWQVVVKALSPDDARFKVEVSSEQFEQPIHKDEATQLY